MDPTTSTLLMPTGKVDPVQLLALATIFVVLAVSTYTELKDNRIPNWITLPAVGIGFLAGYAPGGITLASSVFGFLTGFFFLFVFYMFGGMGGGDVKLMGAIGSLLGYPAILTALVYTAFLGGFMAFAVLIWHHNLWHGLAQSIAMLFRIRKPEREKTEEAEKKMGTIPYGIAIVIGTLMTLYLRGV